MIAQYQYGVDCCDIFIWFGGWLELVAPYGLIITLMIVGILIIHFGSNLEDKG
jgi:hypothetical protein